MRLAFLKSRKWLAFFTIVPLLILFSIFGQQCSRVSLEKMDEEVYFESSNRNPFLLDPPTDYVVNRRIIIVVDMSNSMISGKCPQDVDAGITFSKFPIPAYDPNKGVGSSTEHSSSGIDCKVSNTLQIKKMLAPVFSQAGASQPLINSVPPIFYLTHPGIDGDGVRFKMLENWINDVIRLTTPVQQNYISFMIVPLTGGKNQTNMNKRIAEAASLNSIYTFIQANEPTGKIARLITALKNEQLRNKELVESDDVFRYETTLMGTTAVGDVLKPVYDAIAADMETLNSKGNLSSAEYLFAHIGDGMVTPKVKQFQDVLNLEVMCQSCAGAMNTCAGICSRMVAKLQDAWGIPTNNEINMIEFNMGLIQGLPDFFGAGNVRIDFLTLNRARVEAVNPGVKTYFEELIPKFEAKGRKAGLWEVDSDRPPFRLPGTSEDAMSFKLTNMYVLNLNARLNAQGELEADSDGDGVADATELALGLDMKRSRTNGVCLDIFMANPSFRERCMAMATARSCDPSLDSDGDTLNECEEALIGTDPFDFDTDNDSIPDFFEVLYSYNPLVSDANKDSNGDGYPNLIHFSSGIPVSLNFTRVPDARRNDYEVNYKGKGEIDNPILGHLFVEYYQLIVRYIPTIGTVPVSAANQPAVFSSRQSAAHPDRTPNLIPYERQLLGYASSNNVNTLMALARMVDKNDSTRAYWRIYKADIPVRQTINQGQIDLSKFKLIKAMDRSQ